MEEIKEKTNLKMPKLIDGGIRLYDGYRGAPIWVSKENDSTYYDEELDSQCVVPAVQSIKELKEELGILDSQNVRIHEHDGYRSKPIWVPKENDSTYYDEELDTQCHVPARSIKELEEEFEKELNESSDNPTLKKVHNPTLK